MKRNKNIVDYNCSCYVLSGYYKGYSIWVSAFSKGIIQIRDLKGIRILGYCTKDNLDKKINALDIILTFYGNY